MCVQYDRACHCRLKNETLGDAELGGEVVGSRGQDNAGDGCVGKCTEQASDGAHRRDPRQ